jgi:hypothetical protein
MADIEYKKPLSRRIGTYSVNAVASLPVLFFQPRFNMAFDGTLSTPVVWTVMPLYGL